MQPYSMTTKNFMVTSLLSAVRGSSAPVMSLPDVRSEAIINLDKLTYSANPENVASLSGNPRHIFVMATSTMQRLWSIPSMPIGTTPWSTLPPKAIWTIPFSTRKPFCVYQCPRNPHAFAHCQSLME